jgi:outer membrane protein assembly factor BamB
MHFYSSSTAILVGLLFLINETIGATIKSTTWQFELNDNAGSVVLGNNGLLYFGSTGDDDNFYAVDAVSGALVWNYTCAYDTGDIRYPVLGSNGLVYAADGNNLYAFDALTGVREWLVDRIDVNGLTIDIASNTLYVLGAYEITAIDGATGNIIWVSEKGECCSDYGPPVLGVNGVLYSQFNNSLDARSAGTGAPLWALRPYEVFSDSIIAVSSVDNAVYTCMETSEGEWSLYRLDGSTGDLMWSVSIPYCNSPVLDDARGVVYVDERASSGHLTALSQSDGAILWVYEFPNWENIDTVPLVVADGTIYFGTNEVRMYAMGSDGVVIWTSGAEEFDSAYQAYIASAASDDMVYVGDNDNFISAYALTVDTDTAAPSAAPSSAPSSVAPSSAPSAAVASDTAEPSAAPSSMGTGTAPPSSAPSSAAPTSAPSTADSAAPSVPTVASNVAWTYQFEGSAGSSALSTNGLLYFGSLDDSNDHGFYALNAKTGEFVWRFLTNDPMGEHTPVFGHNGLVYAADDRDMIYAFNALSGILEDSFECSSYVQGLAMDATDNSNVLYILTTNDVFALNGTMLASPAIWSKTRDEGSNGRTAPVLGFYNGLLYCYFDGSLIL